MSTDGSPTPATGGAPTPATDGSPTPTAGGSGTADAVSDSVVRPGHGARAFLRLVMIEHSIFALPFAYVAALSAMRIHGGHVQWLTLVEITVAMVAGRTVAMAANRIIDRHIDAQNPRTAHRELVTGALSLRKAYLGLGISLLVFFVSAGLLNWLCLALSPIALFFLIIYSYAKRFTDFPQVFLGLAQAIGPIGAWLGVTGHWSWTALLLGLAVGAWIGGFDCMYACQDVDVDARIGVRSVPVRFGVANALRASAVVHVVTLGLFVAFALAAGYGPIWWVGLGITALILVYEHAIVRPSDLSRMTRAFFTANGVVSIVLFAFALADLVFLQGLGA
ncbi:menaquinone biosynthesis prenyltransferase MqnP [Actinocatenispora sera]|uniref:4-hydroxybenzoate polyprenyltransferase n=1 Tax=Actinocatenispora sera TaxID=390989 RepID=A0A810KW54_9ACTN|nr:menaquinone biosynthesis prenyltransferase MqnP [Actinocatenispora sera]BCJ26556.1 4-hydroxybenzoate octaprenyltransferase [Actinocatenispora sera]